MMKADLWNQFAAFGPAVLVWPGTALAQPTAKKSAVMIAVTTFDHAVINGDRPLKFPETMRGRFDSGFRQVVNADGQKEFEKGSPH